MSDLELQFNDKLHQIDLTVKDEEARRLRLQVLLLGNENNDLHEQLATGDDRIDELEKEREDIHNQMIEAEENAHRLETELRLSDREVSNLRAELHAMNDLSTDSTKLLTEKLALSRELANLRPELEHLRAQAEHQKTILAEKLALQRLVSSLEVELETEKRALAARAAQTTNENDREEELRAKITALGKELKKEIREKELAQGRAEDQSIKLKEKLEKDLDIERRERERLARQLENGTQEWEVRNSALEGKLDQMRTKLRSTKEQLKETKAELAQAQAQAQAVSRAAPTTSENDTQSKDVRKRKAVQMDLDATIGTPDGVAVRGRRQATKKGRVEQSIVGEKSMFSITPFLNRTTSIAPETPGANREDAEEIAADIRASKESSDAMTIPSVEDNDMPTPSGPMNKRSKKVSQTNEAAEDKVLGESKRGKTNIKQPMLKKKSKLSNTLTRVSEEGDENEEPAPTTTKPLAESSKPDLTVAKIAVDAGEKKKKRKLLGAAKTLFDEEDAEITKRPAKFKSAATKALTKGGLAGPKGGLRGGLASEMGAFGGFSPLKKDKRGAQASFLA